MGYKKVTVELDDGRVLTYRDVIAMTTWTWDDIKYITDLGDTAREFGLTEADMLAIIKDRLAYITNRLEELYDSDWDTLDDAILHVLRQATTDQTIVFPAN